MVKHLISVAVASVLSCGIAFAADNASIEGKEKITRNGVSIYLEPNSQLKKKYLDGKLDEALINLKKAYEKEMNNKEMRAPAPPVTQVFIEYVISQQGGEEKLDFGQTITKKDHGGNPFQVITSVKGYGGSTTDKASFAGNQASMIDIAGLDLNGDKIIDGWAELWDISKPANTSGNFEYTARSINAPGNSMSVGIQIR